MWHPLHSLYGSCRHHVTFGTGIAGTGLVTTGRCISRGGTTVNTGGTVTSVCQLIGFGGMLAIACGGISGLGFPPLRVIRFRSLRRFVHFLRIL